MTKKKSATQEAGKNIGKGLERIGGGALSGGIIGLLAGHPGLGAALGGAYGLGRHAMDMEKNSSFTTGVLNAMAKIADIPLAQNIARPLLGAKTKKLGDVVRTYIKGQGWMKVPPRLGGR